jgi:hypothetical protein
MTHATVQTPAEKCARIKALHYDIDDHIKMYGERFEIVSHPYPLAGGVAVDVISADNPIKQSLRLPVAIILGLRNVFPTEGHEPVDAIG